jgi:hypothetical protein
MADGKDVDIKIGASSDGVEEASTRAKEALKSIGDGADYAKEKFRQLAEIVGIGLGIEAGKEFIGSMAELGEQTERTSHMLGVSTEMVGQLNFAAQATGLSSEMLTTDLGRLQANLDRATKAGTPAAAAFKAIGINAKELLGMPIKEQLETLADAVSKFADGGGKMDDVLLALGRSGLQLLPLLDEGADGIDRLFDAADKTGSELSGATAEAFDETNRKLIEMKDAILGVGERGFEAIEPLINAGIDAIAHFAESLDPEKMRAFATAVVTSVFAAIESIDALAIQTVAAIKMVVSELNNMITPLENLGQKALDVLHAINNATYAVTNAMRAAERSVGINLGSAGTSEMTPPGGTAASGFGAVISPLRTGGQSTDDTIADVNSGLETFKNKLIAVLNPPPTISPGMAPTTAQIGKPPAPYADLNSGSGDKAAADAAEKAAQQELEYQVASDDGVIQSAQKTYEGQIKFYDEEAKAKDISEQQKLALTIAALTQEYTAEEGAYQKELALYQKGTKDYQDVLNKMHDLDLTYNQEKAQLALQAADKIKEANDAVFNTINEAFASNVVDILKGAENIGQAFHKMVATLLVDLIEWMIKSAALWLENTTMQLLHIGAVTAATVTAQEVQTEVTQAGVAAQAAVKASAQVQDAGQAAAGAYASVSSIPIIGPFLAPAAAAVAYGAVMAFDQGSWQLDRDQLAQVHAGEMIVPAAQTPWAQSLLSGAANSGSPASGGGDMHLHINATDPDSFVRQLRDSGSGLMRAINEAMADGHHLRHAWSR